MGSELSKGTRVSVDGSIDYIAKDKGTSLLNFDSWVQENDRSVVQQLARVDILVETENGTGDLWLVETKDFRIITKQPNRKNTDNIAGTLIRKIEETISYIEGAPSCHEEIKQMLPPVAGRVFAFHCEMPVSCSCYFPVNYPLNQFAVLRSDTHVYELVRELYCVDAKQCNDKASIPWRVELK